VNEPDRRRSPDGFDDDAIFADIVAHLNDEATQAEQADRRSGEDVTPYGGTADRTSDVDPADWTTDQTPPGSSDLPGDRPPGEGAGSDGPRSEGARSETPRSDTPRADPGHWYINPPPGPSTPIEPAVDPAVVPAPQVWRAHEVDDEYEEHFEPPPVTPLPAGDLQFWAIIAGMTGGPLLLLYLVFFNRNANSYWILIAIAMSVGGFALLVSRMPGEQDDDDDGARL
jgi:hypothetical protein